jgi:hypothetical protein
MSEDAVVGHRVSIERGELGLPDDPVTARAAAKALLSYWTKQKYHRGDGVGFVLREEDQAGKS